MLSVTASDSTVGARLLSPGCFTHNFIRLQDRKSDQAGKKWLLGSDPKLRFCGDFFELRSCGHAPVRGAVSRLNRINDQPPGIRLSLGADLCSRFAEMRSRRRACKLADIAGVAHVTIVPRRDYHLPGLNACGL